MRHVTLKNLLAKKFRLVLTSIAVMLGVAFMSGTFVLTDTLGSVFDDLFADVNKGVDVAVRARASFDEKAGGPGTQIQRGNVSTDLLPTIKDTDGVAAAEGSVGGYALVVRLDKFGEPGDAVQPQGAPTIGVSWGPNAELNQGFGEDGRPDVGHRPRVRSDADAPIEVALDELTADKAEISKRAVRRCAASGDCELAQVQITFLSSPPRLADVVGVYRFGTTGNLAGATVTAFATPVAQEMILANRDQFSEIHAAAEPGISQRELAGAVRTALRDADQLEGNQVLTGAKLSAEQSDEMRDNLSFFNTFLLVFALVALFVGAFIIYNTFSIIVAQRSRELGLLRALGASGRQVMLSVVAEATVVGLISSVLGLLLGIAVAFGLQELLTAFDIELPTGQTEILPRTIIVSILAGTLVTVVSAISPARRAARVPPMVALLDHGGAPSSGRRRFVVGGILTAIGVVLLFLGLFAETEGVPGGAAGMVGIAAFLVFVGVAMLSPLVAKPAANAVGWYPAHFRGMAGLLARENAERNPRRTASTAAALMIGLALVTFVAIFGASAKASIEDILGRTVQADFLLSGEGFSPVPPSAAAAVRDELDELGPGAQVTEFRFAQFRYDDETKALLGVTPNLGATFDVEPRDGALQRFRKSGGIMIWRDTYEELPAAQRRAAELPVKLKDNGPTVRIPIAGWFNSKEAVGNDYLLSLPLFSELFEEPTPPNNEPVLPAVFDAFVAARKAPDVSLQATKRAIDRALEPFPSVQSEDQEEFAQAQQAQIDQFLNLMYAMLLLAVLIALIGIVNTLALSVLERTRELGLLRAVGMTRKQLRRMIRYEAVIISVFGSLLGLVLGVLFGRAIVQALESDGIGFSLPVDQLVLFVVLAALAGLLAGTWPARRAARLDVLQAIHSQ